MVLTDFFKESAVLLERSFSVQEAYFVWVSHMIWYEKDLFSLCPLEGEQWNRAKDFLIFFFPYKYYKNFQISKKKTT